MAQPGPQQRQRTADTIRQKHRRDTQRQRVVLALLITFVVLASAGLLIWLQFPGGNSAEVDTPNNATDDYGFTLTEQLVRDTDATASAPVEIKLYEDVLCPSCKSFLDESGEFLQQQVADGTITLTYHPIVFLVQQSSNEYSQRATNAAVCVADQAGVVAYANMHDLLLQQQPDQGAAGLSDDELITLATEAGADDVRDCVENRTFEPWLDKALEEAMRLDVSATPTIHVDGVTVVRSQDGNESIPGPAELEVAIESAGAQ